MNIHRNNYEEYFLLYADNELTATEKRIVDIFVQENPDLKEEFYMIQMTVNKPEPDMKLDDKSFLFKTAPAFIHELDAEEIFVLYHDGELDGNQKAATEAFLKEHPSYQQAFELIGLAHVEPDHTIVFADKKSLYRKEKQGRVVSIQVWRWAAAAIIAGMGLWLTIPYLTRQNQQPPVNAGIIKDTPASESTVKVPERKAPEKGMAAAITVPEKSEIKNQKEKDSLLHPDHTVPYKEPAYKGVAVTKPDANKIPDPVTVTTSPVQQATHEEIAAHFVAPDPGTIEKTIEPPAEETITPSDSRQEINPKDNYAQYASIAEDTHDNNYVFYDVRADEFNRSKVGGFIKKVRRIVKRANPINQLFSNEEEQVAAK